MTDGGLSDERLSRMHDVLAVRVESGANPGLVALVGRHGKTHVEVMGAPQASGGAPMRRDTIFRMASVTKPVTAAAVMVLVEECRLRLSRASDSCTARAPTCSARSSPEWRANRSRRFSANASSIPWA